MEDEKDRIGEKLRQKQKGDEDQYFAQRDKALLEKLRSEKGSSSEGLSRGTCPRCGERLATVTHHGVTVDECPQGHGMWFDKDQITTLASRERDSWIGRFFHRPRI